MSAGYTVFFVVLLLTIGVAAPLSLLDLDRTLANSTYFDTACFVYKLYLLIFLFQQIFCIPQRDLMIIQGFKFSFALSGSSEIQFVESVSVLLP